MKCFQEDGKNPCPNKLIGFLINPYHIYHLERLRDVREKVPVLADLGPLHLAPTGIVLGSMAMKIHGGRVLVDHPGSDGSSEHFGAVGDHENMANHVAKPSMVGIFRVGEFL